MNFWQFLSENIGWLIFFGIIFGGSIAAFIQDMMKRFYKHREAIESERTKQMQAQVKLNADRRRQSRPKDEPVYRPSAGYPDGYQEQVME